MQMCPYCGHVYDESEYDGCPNCNKYDSRPTYHIVYDDNLGKALSLDEEEYEEFKKTHPGYH